MKIEVWFDFTCPFCYIGKRNLEIALEQFNNHSYVCIEYKSYRLNPDLNVGAEQTVASMLHQRFGITSNRLQEMAEDIYEQAAQVDLVLHLEKMRASNTLLAHRLTKYATLHAKEKEIINLLFNGYFTDTINLENKQDLLKIANEVGLEKEEVDSILCMNKFTRAVLEDEYIADEMGINSVPFYIFNEKHAISGIQSIELLLYILNELWNTEDRFYKNKNAHKKQKTTYCTGNKCTKK